MSETKWMKERNSKIRIGPEYQAVLPDLIVSEKTSRQIDILEIKSNKKSRAKNIHVIGNEHLNSEKKNIRSGDKEYMDKKFSNSESPTSKVKSATKMYKTNKSKTSRLSIKQVKKD